MVKETTASECVELAKQIEIALVQYNKAVRVARKKGLTVSMQPNLDRSRYAVVVTRASSETFASDLGIEVNRTTTESYCFLHVA